MPSEIVVCLSEDGTSYTPDGDRREIVARELHAAILEVLPNERPGMKAETVHDSLPADGRPRRGDVGKALAEGIGNGWTRRGRQEGRSLLLSRPEM